MMAMAMAMAMDKAHTLGEQLVVWVWAGFGSPSGGYLYQWIASIYSRHAN